MNDRIKNIVSFLDSIEREIKEAKEKIIKENQSNFESHVKSLLKRGDTLFVANGTALLKRGKLDSTTEDYLSEITDHICRGTWKIGFDFEYKTKIK